MLKYHIKKEVMNLNRKVTFKETIELFIINTIYDIKNETEIPRINFVFKEEAYKLFYDIMNDPFVLNKGWTPNIKKENIEFLKNNIDYNYPTIFIKDHIKFFSYLTDITNSSIKIHKEYNIDNNSRNHLLNILKRIWLRMSPNDFNNIENFLHQQLIFTQTDIFNNYKFHDKTEHIITKYKDFKVSITNSLNKTWDESTKCISFKILKENNSHSLPNIYYDIKNDTCYIYAIQNNRNAKKIPTINKEIYKEYRGNSQPNKVYALKLFIKLLKDNNIKRIKVPTLQVLNYDYHKLLSIQEKETFKKLWPEYSLDDLQLVKDNEKDRDLIWFRNVINKEDTISKIKTEDLIKLIYRIVEEDNDLYLTNDIDIDDTLDIKIKTLK